MCWLMKTTAHVHLRYFTVEWYPISSGMLILSFWDNTAVFSWLTRVISIVPRFFTQASLSWYLEQPRLSSLFDWLKFFIPLFSPIRSYHWKDSDVTVSIFPRYSLCNTDAFSHVGSVVLKSTVCFIYWFIRFYWFIYLFISLYIGIWHRQRQMTLFPKKNEWEYFSTFLRVCRSVLNQHAFLILSCLPSSLVPRLFNWCPTFA